MGCNCSRSLCRMLFAVCWRTLRVCEFLWDAMTYAHIDTHVPFSALKKQWKKHINNEHTSDNKIIDSSHQSFTKEIQGWCDCYSTTVILNWLSSVHCNLEQEPSQMMEANTYTHEWIQSSNDRLQAQAGHEMKKLIFGLFDIQHINIRMINIYI